MSGSSSDSGPKANPNQHAMTLDRMREETFDGLWTDLTPHAERNAIFIVDQALDLAEVGLAIARDSSVQVKEWVTSGELARPRADQLKTWDQSPTHRFRFVIVAPYVLIQDLAN